MHTWFNCKIRYEKVMENGMNKKVTEPYLVDALSFTEAESRIIEEMKPFVSGEFSVAAIARENIQEVIGMDKEDGNIFYKVRIALITLDEKSGKEKRNRVNMIVKADSTADAEKILNEYMKGTMSDYVIESVMETAIVDVYFYDLAPETEDTK